MQEYKALLTMLLTNGEDMCTHAFGINEQYFYKYKSKNTKSEQQMHN